MVPQGALVTKGQFHETNFWYVLVWAWEDDVEMLGSALLGLKRDHDPGRPISQNPLQLTAPSYVRVN